MDSGLLLRASRIIYGFLSQISLLLLFVTPRSIQGAPIAIHQRTTQPAGLFEPGTDAWAEALSGVGPLILLIGERSTKQLLRNVRGVHNAFSLAAAPLGLLSIVTSVIRICGAQRLRAFVGYELEARAAAAVEMTRVNCGGVHAEMVDGHIVRSTSADPSGQAIAVSKLEGDFNALATEAVLQIQACNKFKREKTLARMPNDIAPVRWCLRITAAIPKKETINSFVETLANANGIERIDNNTQRFQTLLAGSDQGDSSGGSPTLSPSGTGNTQTRILAPESSDGGSDTSEKSGSSSSPAFPQLTFLCALEAVSEFVTSTPVSGIWASLLGVISASCILALQVIALWQKKWHFSAGWILMFVGYVGIVLGVTTGALLIHSSCICVALETRSINSKAKWVDGIVISVKNTDSMDTTGSSLMSSPKRAQTFEAVWKKDLTSRQRLVSTIVVILLVTSFVSHYLGLRSSKWWISVGELSICLISAFARSVTKDRQEKFSIVDGVNVDKRCSSTGIIRMQKSEKVDLAPRHLRGLDFRAYSEYSIKLSPVTSERIAWHAAKLFIEDVRTSSRILELTGMLLITSKDGQVAGSRAILASFFGGILVNEGLAFPNARMGIAFRSSITELASPTPLLARAIMRQPQWMVDSEELKRGALPIGNVHIPSINSMIDWWTISEDRNEMVDLQKNLHWSLLLINISFYISLLTSPEKDTELVDAIESMQVVTGHESKIAEDVVGFFKQLYASDLLSAESDRIETR
ncbi:hypothetical protein FGG08_004394 [Glutinoglossum americanum]|uniref:Uncharacterized protein n=1 Tax=Glutinoglossum americanum TaxID=1670608 RepID=A0A9P8I7N2_9PEZI|nr:hypothetical protein FGG08_004394 [Glutinoglossum americanum]